MPTPTAAPLRKEGKGGGDSNSTLLPGLFSAVWLEEICTDETDTCSKFSLEASKQQGSS